jgi:hypothetical protein
MRRMVKRSLLVVLTLVGLLFAAPADAQSNGRPGRGPNGSPGNPGHQGGGGGSSGPRAAPEFDPTAAGAIATLLAGTSLIVARRRRR